MEIINLNSPATIYLNKINKSPSYPPPPPSIEPGLFKLYQPPLPLPLHRSLHGQRELTWQNSHLVVSSHSHIQRILKFDSDHLNISHASFGQLHLNSADDKPRECLIVFLHSTLTSNTNENDLDLAISSTANLARLFFLDPGLDYSLPLPFNLYRSWDLGLGWLVERSDARRAGEKVSSWAVLSGIWHPWRPIGGCKGYDAYRNPIRPFDFTPRPKSRIVLITPMQPHNQSTKHNWPFLISFDSQSKTLSVFRYTRLKHPIKTNPPSPDYAAPSSLPNAPIVSSNLKRSSTPRPQPNRRRSSIKSKVNTTLENTFDNSDISLTMDRMILAGESASNRAPPGSKPDETQTLSSESDVFIDLLWECKAADIDSSTPSAHAFDQSESEISLAIHFSGLSSQLIVIKVSRDPILPITSQLHIEEKDTGFPVATAVTSIRCTQEHTDELVILDNAKQLHILIHKSPKSILFPCLFQDSRDLPRAFKDVNGSCLTIETTTSKVRRFNLGQWPIEPVVKSCTSLISSLCTNEEKADFARKMFKHFTPQNKGLEALISTLADFIRCEHLETPTAAMSNGWNRLTNTKAHQRALRSSNIFAVPPESMKKEQHKSASDLKPHSQALHHVLLALHLVAEDVLLDTTTRFENLANLAPILGWLSKAARREDYVGWWQRWAGEYTPLPFDCGSHASVEIDIQPPPSIYKDLQCRMDRNSSSYPVIPPQQLQSTVALQKVFTLIGDNNLEGTVDELIRNGFTNEKIRTLPLQLSVILQEVLRVCQMRPKLRWSAEAYQLIGREDLVANANAKERQGKSDDVRDLPSMETIKNIVKTKKEDESNASNKNCSGVEFDNMEIPKLRFSQDHRLKEVAKMLDGSELTNMRFLNTSGLLEPDFLKEQENVTNEMPERTLSLPYGRGMLTYGTSQSVPAGPLQIPDFDYRVRMIPTNTTYNIESTAIMTEFKEWGEFSNGVASALKLNEQLTVDESWIMLNKPSKNVMSARHSGLMLGLGMNGHLRSMWLGHVQKFLEPKNEFMTIGTMLGVAISYAGDPPERLIGAFSLHVPAILPNHQLEFNLSGLTQAAGLFSLGVAHLGTRQRRQAEILLGEIGGVDVPSNEGKGSVRGSYSLSAALGFGLVMLAKGKEATSPSETQMITKLRHYMHGDKHGHNKSGIEFDALDANFTSPGATLALAMWFLKSERSDVASLMDLPHNSTELDWIRPDFLLFRTLAKNLIMWDSIGRKKEWVESQIPQFIRSALDRKKDRFESVDDSIELGYYNIVAGACLAQGLKFAGTAEDDAFECLLYYMDLFTQAASIKSITYEGKVKRAAIRSGLNTITVALAAVMAGTGELGILKRLRIAHGQFGASSGRNFGSQMATHMALGLLFLGGGEYTLTNSNEAVGFLLCALYPKWPMTPADQSNHPFAYRHLWVKAVQKRCFIPRDVKTNEAVYVPIKIKAVDELDKMPKSMRMIAPTLVPKYSRLLSLKIDSPRYWPLVIDFNDENSLKNLKTSQTFYVKKKAGYLSYAADPRNLKSTASRNKAGLDLVANLRTDLTPDQGLLRSENYEEVGNSLELSGSLSSLASFARSGGSCNFIDAVLLDALSNDKPVSVWYHLTLNRLCNLAHKKTYSRSNSTELVLSARELNYLQAAYRGTLRSVLGYLAPLLQSSMITYAIRTLCKGGVEEHVLRDVLIGKRPEWEAGVYLSAHNYPDRGTVMAMFNQIDACKELPRSALKLMLQLTLSRLDSNSSSKTMVEKIFNAYDSNKMRP
ncbi:hypothetical protein E3P89_01390 [Wallemia ichthyophaga]|uniref:Anaphase-promoting complex subunit 1 beta-sandwich domain-containing protein n=1 Tax=Wallemia ichthyophaga TaxID=245174 RepID=A0A4T0I5X1_WALIC|nr:hypothetical protein E3P90_01790 [Wallemia ichthyophaga]TIB14700.1 hypothetical protein E3P93_01540 [Wallemia ichthyophaga]TIB23713.1 hypothetical protein E3P89_01390 [Wallemia ichthyophaga]TIB25123.1 hypothetical protein E3P88_01745 [Wallemia ichthyophaga]